MKATSYLQSLLGVVTGVAVGATPGVMAAERDPSPRVEVGGTWVVGPASEGADFQTISAAVEAAQTGDTIQVLPGTYVENLRIVQKDLVIRSTGGSAVTTINGNRRGTTVALVAISRDFLLEGFTLTGGVAAQGGGLRMDGGFGFLRDLVIEGNRAVEDGGGVFLQGATPDMKDIVVRNNQAGGDGGGLHLTQAAAFMSDMTVSNNTAVGSGGGLHTSIGVPVMQFITFEGNQAALGGGLASFDSSPALVDVALRGNRADDGGGVYAVYTDIPSGPSLIRSVVEDNEATARGGGLFVEGAVLLLDATEVRGNTASSGGGAWVDDAMLAYLTNTRILDNEALYDGGGLHLEDTERVVFSNLRLTANYAGRYGGGIFTGGSAGWMANVILNANIAHAGGGIYVYFGGLQALNCTLVGNAAAGGYGGGLYLNSAVDARFVNDLVANNSGGLERENLFAIDSTASFAYNVFYAGGLDGVEGIDLSSTDRVVAPLITNGPADGDPWDDDFHLQVESPLIDAGMPNRWMVDPDGGPADVGAYGGRLADNWDLDGDGYFEWWNPLLGPDPNLDDCNDYDPALNPDLGCPLEPLQRLP